MDEKLLRTKQKCLTGFYQKLQRFEPVRGASSKFSHPDRAE